MANFITSIFSGAKRIIGGNYNSDLQAMWCLDLQRVDFVKLKVFSLMQKIFTDCYRYSTKLKDKDKERSMYDSLVYTNSQYGLISMLAWNIAKRGTVYLIYDHGIVREATFDERKEIDKDYKTKLSYKFGIKLDFTNYAIAKLLAHYFHQIYTIEQANNNSISLGGCIQLKIKGLRQKVGFVESQSDEIQKQAKQITKYARDGKPIIIDSDDSLGQTEAETNINIVESSRDRIYRELASVLGGPISYITGEDETTNGSGISYERLDGRAEEMIHNFWLTVFKPIIDALYGEKIEFVSQKWQTIKENLGTVAMIESLQSIPVNIKASIIKKLIGDNSPDKNNEVEKEIVQLLENKPMEF